MFFMCCLKSQCHFFHGHRFSQIQREKVQTPYHLSEHVSTSQYNKSLKNGICIIVIIFGKHTLLYSQILITTMKTGRIPTFGKRAKVKQPTVVQHLTLGLVGRKNKAFSPDHCSSGCQSGSHQLCAHHSLNLKGVQGMSFCL